jgi:hypothetical protein
MAYVMMQMDMAGVIGASVGAEPEAAIGKCQLNDSG